MSRLIFRHNNHIAHDQASQCFVSVMKRQPLSPYISHSQYKHVYNLDTSCGIHSSSLIRNSLFQQIIRSAHVNLVLITYSQETRISAHIDVCSGTIGLKLGLYIDQHRQVCASAQPCQRDRCLILL